MRGLRLIGLVVVLGLAVAAPLAAQDTAQEKSVSARVLKKPPPITCPAGQLGFQRPDGRWVCIAADANPCPQGQVLDKTTKPGFADCKPLPVKTPFSCPTAQLAFQKPDGRWICVAADSNPCPQGQILDTTTKSGFAECKPLPVKTPFSCPVGQLAFQRPDGRWICIAADSNPCPQGQVLDTMTKAGFAQCKGLPVRTPFTCPPGQVVSQRPDGRYVCVAGP